MTDRELLVLAAKAAGFVITGWNEQNGVSVAVLSDGTYWQPLLKNGITDCMGDALRLAVKLKMFLEFSEDGEEARVDLHSGHHWTELCGNDACAAARLAIVRCAAEIVKAM